MGEVMVIKAYVDFINASIHASLSVADHILSGYSLASECFPPAGAYGNNVHDRELEHDMVRRVYLYELPMVHAQSALYK